MSSAIHQPGYVQFIDVPETEGTTKRVIQSFSKEIVRYANGDQKAEYEIQLVIISEIKRIHILNILIILISRRRLRRIYDD